MCLIHKWEYKIEKLKNEKKKYINFNWNDTLGIPNGSIFYMG
jgi:hypothetical protein